MKKDTHLVLANDLMIHPDALIGTGNGLFGAGNQGSGKSVLLKLLLEQIAQKANCPLLFFDKDEDVTGTSALFPRGFIATAGNCPTAKDILTDGLQCVFDLSTWASMDTAGIMIARMVNSLMREAEGTPAQQRVPVVVGMDEASYWLPQNFGKSLDEETYRLLRDAFESVAARGRKRGLVPFLFTQKFSTIAKEVLSPGTYFLMRQNVHTEQQRYLDYILPVNEFKFTNDRQKKLAIGDLRPGQAIVRFADGDQRMVQFHHCRSEHRAHTPSTQAALQRYANVNFNKDARYGAYVEDAEMDLTEETAAPVTGPLPPAAPAPVQPADSVKRARSIPAPGTSIIEPRVKAILAKNPGISDRDLANEAHIAYGDAKQWKQRFANVIAAAQQSQEQKQPAPTPEKPAAVMTTTERIAALHAAEPDLRQFEIADRLGVSRSTVCDWFAKHATPARVAAAQQRTPQQQARANARRKVKKAATPAPAPVASDNLKQLIYMALEQDSYLAPSDLAKRFQCDLETAKQHRASFFSQTVNS